MKAAKRNAPKKKPEINLVLLILVIVFAVVTILGGLTREVTPRRISTVEDLSAVKVEKVGYFPHLCCFLCGIELLLLIFGKGCASRVAGLILHLIAVIAPYPLISLISLSFEVFGYSYRYSINLIGFLLIGLGILIALLYVLDIRDRKKTFSVPVEEEARF